MMLPGISDRFPDREKAIQAALTALRGFRNYYRDPENGPFDGDESDWAYAEAERATDAVLTALSPAEPVQESPAEDHIASARRQHAARVKGTGSKRPRASEPVPATDPVRAAAQALVAEFDAVGPIVFEPINVRVRALCAALAAEQEPVEISDETADAFYPGGNQARRIAIRGVLSEAHTEDQP